MYPLLGTWVAYGSEKSPVLGVATGNLSLKKWQLLWSSFPPFVVGMLGFISGVQTCSHRTLPSSKGLQEHLKCKLGGGGVALAEVVGSPEPHLLPPSPEP